MDSKNVFFGTPQPKNTQPGQSRGIEGPCVFKLSYAMRACRCLHMLSTGPTGVVEPAGSSDHNTPSAGSPDHNMSPLDMDWVRAGYPLCCPSLMAVPAVMGPEGEAQRVVRACTSNPTHPHHPQGPCQGTSGRVSPASSRGLVPAGSLRRKVSSQNREGPPRSPWGEGWSAPSPSSS